MSFKNQMIKSQLFGAGMLNNEDRYSNVIINHIPVLITDDNKIVCLPNSEEMTHIGFTAMTGKGKGIGGNTMLGFEYWMKRRACCIFNDFQQETLEYSVPCKNEVFKSILKSINLSALEYPMVYVYPSNKELIIEEDKKRFPYLKMSLPTEQIIKNIEYFYPMDKSKKYLTANIDQFVTCSDVEDVNNLMLSLMPDKKFTEMRYKIVTIFKNIFDEKIARSSVPEAPDYLCVRRKGVPYVYMNYTIQSLMYAGFIPSIQTSLVRSRPWFTAYMKIILASIYFDKYNDSYFKNKNLSLYVPEIDKMWKGENGLLIKDELALIGTNGRMAGIGLRWDAQDYDAIPDSIRSNTKYLFVGRKSNSDEVKGIKRDFNVTKEIQEQILGLNSDPLKGIFEFIGLTTDRFVVYNMKTGEINVTSEPQKGRLIPPMAQHRVPGLRASDLL